MTQLLVGLVLSAMSGLAFVAYSHPDAYEDMYNTLNLLILIFLVLGLLWRAAMWIAVVRLRDLFKESVSYQCAELRVVPFPFNTVWPPIGAVATIAYLHLLLQLPWLLGI